MLDKKMPNNMIHKRLASKAQNNMILQGKIGFRKKMHMDKPKVEICIQITHFKKKTKINYFLD